MPNPVVRSLTTGRSRRLRGGLRITAVHPFTANIPINSVLPAKAEAACHKLVSVSKQPTGYTSGWVRSLRNLLLLPLLGEQHLQFRHA
jgi:hypothetical protein